ncbi:POK18 protein, partial [Nyctiprogne leucopyga]|nr:POK18 protein [Nyctiprogne leucopyga]
DQWLLTAEKLSHVAQLVKEQLDLGHICPSTSPWNTPIFTIQKKSGKWRLLHDLRAINQIMESMGPLQPGLPSPVMLPQNWHLLIIDLKDWFFTILLHPDDCARFAFTVPAINRAAPAERYEWVVLPQGMKNSPTIWQWFVNLALKDWKKQHPAVIVYHYMDYILFASKEKLSEQARHSLQGGIRKERKKIQDQSPWNYLSMQITDSRVRPGKLKIHNEVHTVNDVQKLVGDIQWIRVFCGITNEEMQPLFDLLKG